jgi:predicted SnoaL-like aldol condensation-catalyzing enzyme
MECKEFKRQIICMTMQKPLRKMIENFEIYLIPYMSTNKNMNNYIDQLRQNNGMLKEDLSNILHVFECFLTKKPSFKGKTEQAIMDLNK